LISLTFLAPPSTNALFANVPRHGRVRTKMYKEWANAAGWEIKAQLVPNGAIGTNHRTQPIVGPFKLSLWLPPGIDLDNCKAIADLLGPGKHGLGITEDDRHMVELHVYRHAGPGCRVEISTAAETDVAEIEVTAAMIDAAVEVLQHDPFLGDLAAGTDGLVEKMLRSALSASYKTVKADGGGNSRN
jgi:hypothetical protein